MVYDQLPDAVSPLRRTNPCCRNEFNLGFTLCVHSRYYTRGRFGRVRFAAGEELAIALAYNLKKVGNFVCVFARCNGCTLREVGRRRTNRPRVERAQPVELVGNRMLCLD